MRTETENLQAANSLPEGKPITATKLFTPEQPQTIPNHIVNAPRSEGARAGALESRSESPPKFDHAPSAGAMFRLLVPAELAAVRRTAQAARDFLAAHRVDEDLLAASELALVEACNNAILYAEGFQQKRPIEVCLLCQSAFIELQVTDHTAGFDWPEQLELPDPEAEHGRGLFIIP
jgi:anti-sigma regulatory factor (Ser/Thr protein kinase)